jgi:general secretion pathway protein B
MSFILDALRKSEHDRQRAAMPGIAQVPFGLPRRELPVWALAVIALLVIALVTLAGALWRSTWPDAARDRAATAPARSEVPLALPPVLPPAESAASVERTAAPDTDAGVVSPTLPAPEERQAPAAASPPHASSAAASSRDARTSPTADDRIDGAAAAEPAALAEQTLPSAAALSAQGVTVPTLRLELHGYAERPADRFVFINGTKYSEGATLAEGPKLVAIAPNGAILSYLGHRFLLAPQ